MRNLPLPWPAALSALFLGGLLFFPGAESGLSYPELPVLLSSCSLVLLVGLLQHRLRRTAGNRWAADAAACALGLGSPLLALSLRGSALPTTALLLYSGLLLALTQGASGRGRMLLAASLWALAGLLLPAAAPAVAALCLTALIAPLARSGSSSRGRLPKVLLRLLALSPALAALLLIGLHPASLSWLPKGLTEILLTLWPGSCGCVAIEDAAAGAVSIPPLPPPAAAWMLLALPGLLPVFSRADHRREALHCITTILFVAAASWLLVGQGSSTPFAMSFLDEASAVSPGLGSGPWARASVAIALAGPFALFFAAAAMAWLRNRPGLSGPRLAGIASGLIAAALLMNLAGILELRGELTLMGLIAAFLSSAAGLVLVALLLPGSASTKGRFTAAGLTAAAAAPLFFLALFH